MPECIEGESPQDYFSRVLAQCSLESATTAENSSGDSAPTPFNLGQVQNDLAQAQADIVELQNSDAAQDTSIENLTENDATGVATYGLGDTSVNVSLPSGGGNWRVIGIVPLEQTLTSVFVNNVGANSFAINFGATAAAGSLNWHAKKIS